MVQSGKNYFLSLSGIVASFLLVMPAELVAGGSLPSSGDAILVEDFNPGSVDLVEKQRLLVDDLELRYGPYDIRLKEALRGLGFRLKQEGQFEEASLVFKRALHVSRVNEGLNNESQLAIVERLIEVDQQLAAWDEVNDHFTYLEHLYKKLYKLDDPRLEQGLRKVVAWHFDASNFNLNGNRIEHLRKAHGLLKLRLQSAELTLSGEDPLLDSLKRNIERSEYYLYLNSELYQELSSERRRSLRDRYLANID